MLVPPAAVYGVIVLALYCLAAFVVYRHLFPRLPRGASRLASIMLLAQLLAIGGAFLIEPASSFEAWLWSLNEEWNIQATLASTQWALAGAIAVAAAWIDRERRRWQRRYLLGIGLTFLFLARDEYFVEHEFVVGWVRNFALLGAALVAATLLVAWRSPPSQRVWHVCLLAGLATAAAGGLLIETQCGDASFMAIISCSDHFLLEEPLEFLGVWLALVAMLGHLERAAPSLRIQRALYFIPALWLILLIQGNAVYSVARYAGGTESVAVEFESDARLLGILLENNKKHINLFLSPGRWDYHGQNLDGLGYSIHLVDQVTGDSVFSRNSFTHRRFFLLTPGYAPAYRQWVEIERPDAAKVNRAYWIVLSLWRDEGGRYTPLKINASDLELLDDTQVILGEKVWRETSTAAAPDPLAIFDNGFALDAWEAPETARAGQPLTLEFFWRSDADGQEDYAQFLHLGHSESGEWQVYDQAPLGGAIADAPCGIEGLVDSETWHSPRCRQIWRPDAMQVFSGLYRTRDQERIPARTPAMASISRMRACPWGAWSLSEGEPDAVDAWHATAPDVWRQAKPSAILPDAR